VDRLESMSMLVAVAECGSLSAAARRLNVPVPTLTRKVTDLETRLGARLLVRTTRRLTLTDAGVGFVDAARRILEQVDDAERDAAGEYTTPKGQLVITAPVHFGRQYVLPVATDFLALYPDIRVRLVLVDRNIDLVDAHVDMAVRIGRLPDSTMVATEVGRMRTVVCASPNLLDGRGTPRVPDDLSRFPAITVDTPMFSTAWRFRTGTDDETVDVSVRHRLQVTTTEAAAQAAVAGVGVVRLLQYQVADALASGALRIVLDAFEPHPVPVHLLHASRGQMPVKMRRFIDFAVSRLRERLAAL